MSEIYYDICRIFENKVKNYSLADMNSHLLKTDGKNKKILHLKTLTDTEKQKIKWYPLFQRIYENAYKQGLVDNLIVHGSFGDFTNTNYSDLEITVVLPDTILRSENLLKKLQKWINQELYHLIYTVDPLQHHGPFYLWPDFLNAYDESILPIVAYEHSWAIKEQEIHFQVADYDIPESIEKRTLATYNRLKLLESSIVKNGCNLYLIKDFTSNIMMLPVFYFSDQGILLSKKSAIEQFYNHFSGDITIFKTATELRDIWPEISPQLKYFRIYNHRFKKLNRYSNKLYTIALNYYSDVYITNLFKNSILSHYDEICIEMMKDIESRMHDENNQ